MEPGWRFEHKNPEGVYVSPTFETEEEVRAALEEYITAKQQERQPS